MPGDTPRTYILMEIAAERERQVAVEKFDEAHDDAHVDGELAAAAACYATHAAVFARLGRAGMSVARIISEAINAGAPRSWPWHPSWWKPRTQRSSLIRAAALLVAELERIDRIAPQNRSVPPGQS